MTSDQDGANISSFSASPESEVKDAGYLHTLPDAERAKAIFQLLTQELEDDKAEDIVTIDMAGKSDIADKMIIASGRSQRHVGAIADKLLRRLKEAGFSGARVEGKATCDWVLIDAQDVIVHLFRPEVRSFYNLERIWSEAAHAVDQAD